MKENNILVADEAKAKEEIKCFNNWQGHAKIMYDAEDGEIWTDVFASEQEWKEYHSDTIFCAIVKDGLHGRNQKTNYNNLLDAIKLNADYNGIELKAI